MPGPPARSGSCSAATTHCSGPSRPNPSPRCKRSTQATWIRGNVDRWAADQDVPEDEVLLRAIADCREALGAELADELGGLPEQVVIDGTRYCHASPLSDMRSFLPEPGDDDEQMLAGASERRVVFGHTHLQFRRRGPWRHRAAESRAASGCRSTATRARRTRWPTTTGRSSIGGSTTTATRRSAGSRSGSETSPGRSARSGGCRHHGHRAPRSWYRSQHVQARRVSARSGWPSSSATTVSVCLPARNEARTIGPILEQLSRCGARGIVDQVVVVDHSTDGTGEIARGLGAEVHDQDKLLPEHGPVLGKGDAMWRALRVLTGEIVCFLDADSEEFGAHYVCGLLGPLLCTPAISFVKGFYRRPFRVGETTFPDGGGRVTELTARPLLNLFYPDLAAVRAAACRARSRPGASCSSGCRSSPATASTSRC